MSDHVHAFDPISGWCGFCTVRDDGRHTWLGDPIKRNSPDPSLEGADHDNANHA